MATKRSFSEVGLADKPGESAAARSSHQSGPSTKRRKQDAAKSQEAGEKAISWKKRRARDIERLFQKDTELPANIRNELERELAAHKANIADKEAQRKRSKMISKYHMVRFFERKKAMRRVKQLRRKIEQSSNEAEKDELRHSLHVAEVDEAYTLHYPHVEPYVSLYGTTKTDDGDGDLSQLPAAERVSQARRPPMWTTIEQAMKEGPRALHRLRERTSPVDGGNSQPKQTTQNVLPNKKPPTANSSRKENEDTSAKSMDKAGLPQLNRRERRRLLHQTKSTQKAEDEEDDDGGGFFEEA